MANGIDVRLAISPESVDMAELRRLSDAYRSAMVDVRRYYVASEVRTETGGERLFVLSDFFVSVAAAERRLTEVLADNPSAQILMCPVTLNLADWCDARRMSEYCQRAIAESGAIQ